MDALWLWDYRITHLDKSKVIDIEFRLLQPQYRGVVSEMMLVRLDLDDIAQMGRKIGNALSLQPRQVNDRLILCLPRDSRFEVSEELVMWTLFFQEKFTPGDVGWLRQLRMYRETLVYDERGSLEWVNYAQILLEKERALRTPAARSRPYSSHQLGTTCDGVVLSERCILSLL